MLLAQPFSCKRDAEDVNSVLVCGGHVDSHSSLHVCLMPVYEPAWMQTPSAVCLPQQLRAASHALTPAVLCSSSMNARRQSESRMLRHALSGFFPGPAHSDDGKGEHIKDGEDEEEEELFSRAEVQSLDIF